MISTIIKSGYEDWTIARFTMILLSYFFSFWIMSGVLMNK
jgi:hypothetical protein